MRAKPHNFQSLRWWRIFCAVISSCSPSPRSLLSRSTTRIRSLSVRNFALWGKSTRKNQAINAAKIVIAPSMI